MQTEGNVQNPPDQRKPIHHPDTASRVFSGEAVVITPAENQVRMFNQIGSRIWELADGAHTVADIVAVLCAEYEVEPEPAAASVAAFLATLHKRGLILFVDQ